MARILLVLIVIALAAAGVYYNEEIIAFSRFYQVNQETRELIALEQFDEAIALYEQARSDNPDNDAIALALARLYRHQGRFNEAESIYKDLLAKEPDHLNAALGYANMLRFVGFKVDPARMPEAVMPLQQVFLEHKHNPRLLSALGNVYKTAAESPAETRAPIKEWLYQWAVYYYRLSLAFNPEQFQEWFNLGVIYQEGGNYEKAATHYCNALILAPESYEASYNLGLALIDLGYPDAAVRQLDHSVNILIDQGRVPKAQELKLQAERAKHSIETGSMERTSFQSRSPAGFLDPACLAEQAVSH